MSSVANHRKRSHRSEYRARPYSSGARQAAITPTLRRNAILQQIHRIRAARNIKKKESTYERAADQLG